MALETYTGYIPALVDTNPPATDPAAQGANHIRGIKLTLSQTFIGFTEPDVGVTKKASEINDLYSTTDATAALALKADIDSPALTGIPTAPTAAPGDNSTQIATTAYADAAALAGQGIGYDQTWQNVTGSRVSGTTYTNDTGKPIEVKVRTGAVNSGNITLNVGGVDVDRSSNANDNDTLRVAAIVPTGATYSCTSSVTINTWVELR